MDRWCNPLSRLRIVIGAVAIRALFTGLGGYGVKADPPPAKAPGRESASELRGTVSAAGGIGNPMALPDLQNLSLGREAIAEEAWEKLRRKRLGVQLHISGRHRDDCLFRSDPLRPGRHAVAQR